MYIESDNDPMEIPHCAIRMGREIGKGRDYPSSRPSIVTFDFY